MNKSLIAATAAAFFFATPMFAASADPFAQFTGYVAFGDSLTDDGKFLALPPPSFNGRFSNGRVYAEYIADAFSVEGKATSNFALGGATAEADNETAYPFPNGLSTFADQVTSFDLSGATDIMGNNPLVSVLFGANDIFQDLGEGPLGTIGQAAANAVKAGIESIAALGPQFNDFVLINLPDLSLTPAFSGGPFAAFAQIETLNFNQQLAAHAEFLRNNSGLNIIEVDQDAFLKGIIENPSALGITNTTEACTESLSELSFDNCAFTGTEFDISLADTYTFADDVHPTGPVHEAFAREFTTTVAAAAAPVPLPAGGVLLLAGLGVLAVARRLAA